MSSFVVDWLSMLGRWLHLITGVAWIGASFYFIWLDNHLLAPKNKSDSEKGVGGELWAVHGGGFYHAQKYAVAPLRIPAQLHWFKWEAYSTWISGMFLLALIYWYGAEIYLIDIAVKDLSKSVAVIIGAASVGLGWVIYDLLCKSALGRNDSALGWVIALLSGLLAWGLCQLFSGRGAYIHFGAVLGTIMVANVFFVIIPAQKKMVAAAIAGHQVDPAPGLSARQRSVHNTYFTLPVLFTMISNHYAMTYAHRFNWLVLILISAAGALIRLYFVRRHKGQASWWSFGLAALLLGATSVMVTPRSVAIDASQTVDFNQVATIIYEHCTSCHAQTPGNAAFPAPPAGVILQTPAQIEAQAERIYQQTVVLKAMPLGNLGGMTQAQRQVIAQWYAGARTATP